MALVLCGLLIAGMAGCTTGTTASGDPMVGLQLSRKDGTSPAVDAAGGIGTMLGGIFGGPGGAVVGGSLATALATLIFGKKRESAVDLAYDQGHAAGRSTAPVVVAPAPTPAA